MDGVREILHKFQSVKIKDIVIFFLLNTSRWIARNYLLIQSAKINDQGKFFSGLSDGVREITHEFKV